MKKKSILMLLMALSSLLILSCTKNPSGQGGANNGNIVINPTTLSVTSVGGEYIVNVSAENSWSISAEENMDWVNLDIISGEKGENIPVTVTVSQNTTDESRIAEFTFTCEGTSVNLLINQSSPKDEKPQLPEATNPNTFIINGEEYQFGSTVSFMVDENPAVAASPAQGLSSWEEIFAEDEYFFAAVSPLLVGKEIDIMTEPQLFTIMSQLSGAILETVSPSFLSEVTMGNCIYENREEGVFFKGAVMLTDGTILSVNIETENSVEQNENTISRGDEVKIIRSSFYMEEDGYTTLYFTPAELYSFDELSIATWYVYILVEDSILNSDQLDITSNLSYYMIGMEDNLDPDNSWSITSDDASGATGFVSIYKNGEGNYTASMDILYGGVSYTVNFSGESIPYDYYPEEPDNYFVYGSDRFNILSSSLTNDSQIATVSLMLDNGSSVIITLPVEFIDGNSHGFSQSEYLTVTYNDVLMSKATGYSGTILASYNDSGEFHIEFTNYDDCEFSYTGIPE